MPSLLLRISCVFCLLLASLPAQPTTVTVNAGPTYIIGGGQRGIVKDSFGTLYVLGALDNGTTRPLAIFRSTDNGLTFAPWITTGISDATSGESGTNLLNSGALAIDDQNRLHIKWARNYYPSYFNSYYRSFDTVLGTAGPLVDINATFGISTASRDASGAILQASDGRIWMTSPSSNSWREQLLVSSTPYAATATFSSVGICSGSGSSAQNTRLACDINGIIHTFFYRNSSSGEVAHRSFDPATAQWGTETALGNTTTPQDNYTDIAADYLGNVHALYCVDGSGGTINPRYEYRRWDAAGGWSPPIVIASFTNAQLTDPVSGLVSSAKAADLCCNETTGDVYITLRDFGNGGGLRVFRKAAAESAFYPTHELAPANASRHHYYAPSQRGSLFPSFDNTLTDLDILWRENGAAPLSLQYAKRAATPLGVSNSVGAGCIGSSGQAATLSAPPAILGDANWAISVNGGPALGSIVFYLALGPPAALPWNQGGNCNLYLDPNAALYAIAMGYSPIGPFPLDAGGAGQLPLPLAYAPALAGFQITTQGYLPDALAPTGFVLTNLLDIRLGY